MKLTQSKSPSVSSLSLDYILQVDLRNYWIVATDIIFRIQSMLASKCITKVTQSPSCGASLAAHLHHLLSDGLYGCRELMLDREYIPKYDLINLLGNVKQISDNAQYDGQNGFWGPKTNGVRKWNQV